MGIAAAKMAPINLNVRIDDNLNRELEVAVARKGITKQRAVEEALRMWITSESIPVQMVEAPLIPVTPRADKLNLTGDQVDELLFG